MSIIFLTIFCLYSLLFLLSLRLKDNSLVDVFWGIGFMVIAVLSYVQSERWISQIFVTVLVLIWWFRLTLHIGIRKFKERKEDPRYAKWRAAWWNGRYFYIRSFLQVYLLQMVAMFFVATAILIVNFQGDIFPSFFMELGLLIAVFGLVFESIADEQLGDFIKTKKPWEIFTEGLYRYSRHPNYFGESMFWLGISCIALQYSYLGLISWIVITFLLLFVSGVPLQEERYAGRPEWEVYKKKTNVFVPWKPKK